MVAQITGTDRHTIELYLALLGSESPTCLSRLQDTDVVGGPTGLLAVMEADNLVDKTLKKDTIAFITNDCVVRPSSPTVEH